MKYPWVFPLSIGCLLLGGLGWSPDAHALVLYPSADPAYNTTAPGGALSDSGWQYTGFFLGFTGYPISPDAFLVSKHVVGGLHQGNGGAASFTYLGKTYTTVARFDEPDGADLTVLKIDPLAAAGAFPSFAPLYPGRDEVGRNFTIFGRGVIRGAQIDIPSDATTAISPNGTFRGWQWAADAGPLRWGENRVDLILRNLAGVEYLFSSLTRPEEGGLPNEAVLGVNDSSGGVFIRDPADGLWKLAALNSGVDSSFSLSPGSPAIGMGLVDAGGLYDGVNPLQDTAGFNLVFGDDYKVFNGANNPVRHVVGSFHIRISSVLPWLLTFVTPKTSEVVGRYIFYNQSAWDGNDLAANANDDLAIASDKTALQPGGVATFGNYTSYSRGINGIMVDILGLPGNVSSADFGIKVGNSQTPADWPTGPAPSAVTIRAGQGVGGADRVTLTWPDKAIVKQWVQVTVLANANTGLGAPEVFYFGNAIGETGNSASDAKVTSADGLRVLNNVTLNAPLTSGYDINRDGKVTSADYLIVLNNASVLQPLVLLDAPVPMANSPVPAGW